jgi:hypothetical protein
MRHKARTRGASGVGGRKVTERTVARMAPHTLKGEVWNVWSIDIRCPSRLRVQAAVYGRSVEDDGRWHLLFRSKDGDALDVHIFDPH